MTVAEGAGADWRPGTTAVHADVDLDDGPDIAPPIHVSTTYARSGPDDELIYRRDDSRTVERLEAVLGALEGGRAVAFASGMAAITAVIRALRPKRVSLPAATYHGTRLLLELDVADGVVELVTPDALEAGDVWWLETPANPTCEVADVAAIAEAGRARGVVVVVDSTFATPLVQRPLELGAHVVVHATTKAINGHSDALGGVAVTDDEALADRLVQRRVLEGAVIGSLDAWLTLRGVRTLPLRMRRQAETAATLVEALEPLDVRRWYPTIGDPAQVAIATRQMVNGGSIFSFEFGGTSPEDADARASRCVGAMRLIRVATSLGGVETLAEHRRTVDDHARPGLIRVSVGIEEPEDLLDDLVRAIEVGLG